MAHGNDNVIVRLAGEIDDAASLELMPWLEKILQNCDCRLSFDLEEVTLIDSEGLKVLLIALDRMAGKDCPVRISKCSERALRVMKLAGVDRVFKLHHLLDELEAECVSWPSVSEHGTLEKPTRARSIPDD